MLFRLSLFVVMTFVTSISSLVVAPLSAQAVDFSCGTSGTYTVSGTKVISNNECTGNLTIDSSVTVIGANAFQNAILSAVVIPGTVTTIEDRAFQGIRMTSLSLGEGITSIGYAAFYGFSPNSVNIVLPNSLTSLGSQAFENSYFGSLTIGNGLTNIDSQTFYNNFGWGVTNVVFGSAIQNIGFASFQGYRGTKLEIPEGVTTIASRAFEGANNLKRLFLPESLTSIGVNAFNGTTPDFVIYCGSTSAVSNYSFGGGVVPQCAKVAIFEANGGSGIMNPQLVSPGVSTTLTSNSFTNTGFSFAGWNTRADGTGVQYPSNSSYSFGAHITLYAQWVAIPKVIFNANGGTGSMQDQFSTFSANLSDNAFSRCNYEFSGWSTQADGSGTDYANQASYPFSATSTTLFAQWSPVGDGAAVLPLSWGPVISGTNQPAMNDRIWDLEISPIDGKLYAAGFFTNADAIPEADYVAVWDGTTWAALGSGTNIISVGTGSGSRGIFDIAFDSSGNLYAAGNFTVSGVARNFAKWNGSTWSSVGGINDFSDSARAVEVDSLGNIYVGGLFENVSGISRADFLAKWSGSSWNAVGDNGSGGPAVTSYVQSLALGQNNVLYIGSWSQDIGGQVKADNVAKWNGLAWSALGGRASNNGQITYAPRSIEVDKSSGSDIVYLAMNTPFFLSADGEVVESGYLIKWDGTSWSQAFSDVQIGGPVTSLVFPPQGGVIVAGWFDGTGTNWNNPCNTLQRKLAYFDGAKTVALGADGNMAIFQTDATNGFYGGGRGIDSLALTSDGRLYVGGAFENAASSPQSDWIALSSVLFPVLSTPQQGTPENPESPATFTLTNSDGDPLLEDLADVTPQLSQPMTEYGQPEEQIEKKNIDSSAKSSFIEPILIFTTTGILLIAAFATIVYLRRKNSN